MRPYLSRLAASAALLVFLPGNGFAASPQEDLVLEWLKVQAFGAPVKIGSTTYDPANAAVVLEDVTIGEPGAWLVTKLGTLTVTDPRRTPAGRFAAHAVRGETLSLALRFDPKEWFPELATRREQQQAPAENGPDKGGDVTADVSVPDTFQIEATADVLLYERLETTLTPPNLPAASDPIGRWLAFARWNLTNRADWFELGNVKTKSIGMPEGDSEASYELIYATGIRDGRIERSGYNNMRQTGTMEGVASTYTEESAYLTGIDMAAALEVLDPAAGSGKPDGRWRTVIQQQGSINAAYEQQDFKFTVGLAEMNLFQLRRTEKPMLEILRAAMADPAAVEADPARFASDLLPAITGLFRIGSVAVDNVEFTGPEKISASLGEFDMVDIDSDGIGAIVFRRGALTVDEQNSGKFGIYSLNDIRFGSWKPILDLIAASEQGGEPPPDLVLAAALEGSPRVGFSELNNVQVDTAVGTFGLSALTVAGGDWLKSLARRTELAWTSLSFPVSVITDPTVRDELTAMGYEDLSVSGALSLSWDSDKGIGRVDDATLRINDMGMLSMDLEVTGIPLSILEKPDELEQRFQEAALASASLRFGNHSIVERTFEAQAAKLNQPADTFRENFANALPLMLGFLEDKTIQDRFQAVLKDFFKDPKSLVVSVKPVAPLPFTAIEALGNDGPGPLLDALNFKITAND